LGVTFSDLSNPLTVNDAIKVLFAGEATTDEYFSTVHGAMYSGQREADIIIKKLSSEAGK
jgi:monoamine oxidase